MVQWKWALRMRPETEIWRREAVRGTRMVEMGFLGAEAGLQEADRAHWKGPMEMQRMEAVRGTRMVEMGFGGVEAGLQEAVRLVPPGPCNSFRREVVDIGPKGRKEAPGQASCAPAEPKGRPL
jgi:hypothetical protein